MAARGEARAGAVPQSGHQLALYLRPSPAPEFRRRPPELRPRPLAVRVATADWSAANQWPRGNGPGCQRAPQPVLPCVQPSSPAARAAFPGAQLSTAQPARPAERPGTRAPSPPPRCARAHGAWAEPQALRCFVFQGFGNSGDRLSRPADLSAEVAARPLRRGWHCGVLAR